MIQEALIVPVTWVDCSSIDDVMECCACLHYYELCMIVHVDCDVIRCLIDINWSGRLSLDYWLCVYMWNIYCTGCMIDKLNAVMSHRHVIVDCSTVSWLTQHWTVLLGPIGHLPHGVCSVCIIVIVIILLGVSSRICCLPADKGKGIVDRPWAWRAKDLYMWARRTRIGFPYWCFRLVFCH